MENWKNTATISCVSRSGEPLTVIEQSRVDRIKLALNHSETVALKRRFVLGNGAKVQPIDAKRFVLIGTHEVVQRCLGDETVQ